MTRAAAAFTTWDPAFPRVAMGRFLRISCSVVMHCGKRIGDKTPRFRCLIAVQREVLRLLNALGLAMHAKALRIYPSWEHELFAVDAPQYKAPCDVVNCGFTLIRNLPTQSQHNVLKYFGPVPFRVEKLLRNVQAEMLKVGCPMVDRHKDVAPGELGVQNPKLFCLGARASHAEQARAMAYSTASSPDTSSALGLHAQWHQSSFRMDVEIRHTFVHFSNDRTLKRASSAPPQVQHPQPKPVLTESSRQQADQHPQEIKPSSAQEQAHALLDVADVQSGGADVAAIAAVSAAAAECNGGVSGSGGTRPTGSICQIKDTFGFIKQDSGVRRAQAIVPPEQGGRHGLRHALREE